MNCIDREAAINHLTKARLVNDARPMREIFADLQIVKPERSKGKWLTPYGSYSYRLTTYKCSLCECETENNSNYCPHCGADMRG